MFVDSQGNRIQDPEDLWQLYKAAEDRLWATVKDGVKDKEELLPLYRTFRQLSDAYKLSMSPEKWKWMEEQDEEEEEENDEGSEAEVDSETAQEPLQASS